MSNYYEDSTSSLEDSEDLDDIPLSLASNGRHEYDEPPLTSRGPPLGFSRPGTGFNLKLPTPKPDDLPSPGPDGLKGMRSEPAYLVETACSRSPLGMSIGPARAASTSYNGEPTDEGVTILGRRGPLKPPMLSLINPASASPVPSGAPTPAVNDAGEVAPRVAAWPVPEHASRPRSIRVDLVSSAFVIQGSHLHDPTRPPGEAASTSAFDATAAAAAGTAAPSSTCERIVQRCSSQLGIAPCDLEFFELRALEGFIPESCTRVGVMIRGSTFSLSALEDLLSRSKRDSQLATILEGALRDSSQHAAEAKQHAEKLAKQNEEMAVLRERLRNLELVNQHLREQLQRSDEHRHLLGSTIRTIKKEFEDFKSRVVVEGSLEQLPLQELNLGTIATVAGSSGGPFAGGVSGALSNAENHGQDHQAAGLGPSGTTGPGDGGGAATTPAASASVPMGAAAPAASSEDAGTR